MKEIVAWCEPVLLFISYLNSCPGKMILSEQEVAEVASCNFSCIKVKVGWSGLLESNQLSVDAI